MEYITDDALQTLSGKVPRLPPEPRAWIQRPSPSAASACAWRRSRCGPGTCARPEKGTHTHRRIPFESQLDVKVGRECGPGTCARQEKGHTQAHSISVPGLGHPSMHESVVLYTVFGAVSALWTRSYAVARCGLTPTWHPTPVIQGSQRRRQGAAQGVGVCNPLGQVRQGSQAGHPCLQAGWSKPSHVPAGVGVGVSVGARAGAGTCTGAGVRRILRIASLPGGRLSLRWVSGSGGRACMCQITGCAGPPFF